MRSLLERLAAWFLVVAGVCAVGGCGGRQSALNAAGREAALLEQLFWIMVVGAVLVWAVVMGVAVYALLFKNAPHADRSVRRLIIGGGVILPTVVLAVLLTYGLALMPELRTPPADAAMTVAVSGEQWWWRVHYRTVEGEAVPSANEVRIPVDTPVEFVLTSPDVIHSFWIPALAGKLDMIPGRVTRMVIEATETGVYRGACAEYCGASHALMNFEVVVMQPAAFEEWLREQAEPARPPETLLQERGRALFLSNGCGACHRIRGTRADGGVGPDLTHVGGRLSLAAGVLPNDVEAFARWIERTERIKPDVEMPSFHMLPDEDVRAIATYLEGLQ